ncbi:hypothetical protein PoB_005868200 [Plakobranchus ocellatus]|uniref:Uncharacterized protein n=1 Tax=Plakobranchus ocellatus TaxID=259542 RepID=A0AAV4CL28_9GAST|nr:hypothetical protein PoB_005868200 [Plakobranchus ocellatus]
MKREDEDLDKKKEKEMVEDDLDNKEEKEEEKEEKKDEEDEDEDDKEEKEEEKKKNVVKAIHINRKAREFIDNNFGQPCLFYVEVLECLAGFEIML